MLLPQVAAVLIFNVFLLQHKPRKKNTPDEPECIALSSDEEDSNDADDKKDQDGVDGVQNGEGNNHGVVVSHIKE